MEEIPGAIPGGTIHMKKRRLLIIVNGAKPLHFHEKFLNRLYRKIMEGLSSPKGMFFSDYKKLKKFMQPYYDKVILLKWDGNIFRFPNLEKTARNFAKFLIKKKDKYGIDIISFSLGCFVTERALDILKDLKVKKIIFVGAVHEPRFKLKFYKRIYNICSKKDKLALLANKVYGFKSKKHLKIKKNKLKNICFKSLNHDDLSKNVFVEELKKNLYDFYKDLLIKSTKV